MRFDRRVTLFAVLSVVSFALVPLADTKYERVPLVVGCTYALLSVGFLLDWWSRSRDARRDQ